MMDGWSQMRLRCLTRTMLRGTKSSVDGVLFLHGNTRRIVIPDWFAGRIDPLGFTARQKVTLAAAADGRLDRTFFSLFAVVSQGSAVRLLEGSAPCWLAKS